MTALVGANGCGKSTLLKTLCGMLPAVSGSVSFTTPRPSMAWLPQHSDIEKSFPLTVFDLVVMGFWRHCGWFRGISRQQRQQALSALDRVNMLPFAEAAPGTLSGGNSSVYCLPDCWCRMRNCCYLTNPLAALIATPLRYYWHC
ncbi:ATP-binding cassette domain-containing protein [Erwinia rhapontici]|uniref:ATP-binding cassette domain-containing protein n=1 Tax=Erwinia rhapontici TaxID=55212 RepID=UPI003211A4D4